ncbi:MAG: hypothetical protein GYA41_00235 [Bacteroidales bacterium]|nr:hypothetical protein [Bacteroidales bacterium]
MTGIRNEMLKPASDELIRQELSYPISVYSSKNIPGNIMLGSSDMSYTSMLQWSLQ